MSQFIHPNFKLNGQSFDLLELLALALQWSKEGMLYEKETGNFLLDWLNNETHLMVTTSGSTGKPKKIYLSKKAMKASAEATASYFHLKPKDTALLCLSAQYIAGKMMLVRALQIGMHIDVIEPSTMPLQRLTKSYDFAAMVPLQVAQSLSDLSKIKTLLIGGAKLQPELVSKLAQLPTQIYETYGMTETITHIAVKRVGESNFSLLPHVKITVDERNCLVIHAPFISEEAIVTNDVVEVCSPTQFKLKGRWDNVINSGGIKIFPEELEDVLSTYITSRFFIASLPDALLGEKVVLVIEAFPFEINSKLFENLTTYQKPKAIYFVPTFIETPTQKINRKKTLELIQPN
ncbi:MAG: o-succinylbenzoate--CoA ligase [Bacteroidota bacterium]